MRLSLATIALAGSTSLVSAAVIPKPTDLPSLINVVGDVVGDFIDKFAKALPKELFEVTRAKPISLEEAKAKFTNTTEAPGFRAPKMNLMLAAQGTCANPRVRVEWDSLSNNDRQAFVNGLKCLLGRSPSGQFSQSRNRYEDLVALHQTLTPNVHESAKFLVWHRYFLWTFEDILRSECGFNAPLPWFDETRYAGRFRDSSLFSDQWFGGIAASGNCITNGQFANLALNVGPSQNNERHCLARDDRPDWTINCNQDYVDYCNSMGDFASMAGCAESGPHAWGHNGIGSVMLDVWASPGDPIFWLHHGFVDRNWRIWQNQNSERVRSINGNDKGGNPLTLDTTVNVYGMRRDVTIREILDTTDQTLCYKYNY
ncbi:hypothetical protein B0J11DRAFT_280131 [Dendryphion nanum]|uniref:Tyrosinase copper-binding domain-containing protein n=1 Tax=Dendryphion nanum TaxID=256645 RepID=A0A9P9IQ08_9PLEO|nr:hypothetical protein B0J11DRAFT_280131 [Dendryphion nanum]